MPTGTPKTTTPREVAMFGHIAVALRKAMEAKGWSIGDLNQALGRDRAFAGTYAWVGGRGAPSPENAQKVSKLLGIPMTELTKRDADAAPKVTLIEPGRSLVTRVSPATTIRDVLSFKVNTGGEARLQLDATLPVEKAMPLLRMLLDAGIVFSE